MRMPVPPVHPIGNPLAVPWPHPALPPAQAKAIVEHSRHQHRLWTLCVALALVALVLVTLFDWIGPRFFGWHLTPSRERVLAQLDLLALGVLALELGAQFGAAKNKALFLRQNWLMILALLPLGILVRGMRVFEGLESLRAFQLWGKFGELGSMLPTMNIPIFSPLLSALMNALGAFSSWTGLDELFELTVRLISRFSR